MTIVIIIFFVRPFCVFKIHAPFMVYAAMRCIAEDARYRGRTAFIYFITYAVCLQYPK